VLDRVSPRNPAVPLVEADRADVVRQDVEHGARVALSSEQSGDVPEKPAAEARTLGAGIDREQAEHRGSGWVARQSAARTRPHGEPDDVAHAVRRDRPRDALVELPAGASSDALDSAPVAGSTRLDPHPQALLDVVLEPRTQLEEVGCCGHGTNILEPERTSAEPAPGGVLSVAAQWCSR